MLRQFTFTTSRAAVDGTGGGDGPGALLVLISDSRTALRLIQLLSTELQRTVDEDNPITVGLTGEIEGDLPGELAEATGAAEGF